MNSPLNPETGEILDDSKLKASISTLKFLENAKIVAGSHQGRPGDQDFITLKNHASKLERLLGREVKFIEDVIGPKARETIQALKDGEVMLLDNLRLCSEETLTGSPEEMVKTIFIRRLTPFFNLYVNDAFAAAHRAHPSIVGFPQLIPGLAGKNMEAELDALQTVTEKALHPSLYVISGVKAKDRIPIVEHALKSGKADKVLLGGLMAEIFLHSKGYVLGVRDKEKIEEFSKFIPTAKSLLETYRDRILLPVDLAVNVNGKREELPIEKFPTEAEISDIGAQTIESYRAAIKEAKIIVAVGPLGIFELEPFSLGTKEIIKAMIESQAYVLIGGGHLGGAAETMGLADKISHMSTGGGALLTYLSGKPLPAMEALIASAKKFGKESVEKK